MSKKAQAAKAAKEAKAFEEGFLVVLLVISVVSGITIGDALGGTPGAWWGLLLALGVWTGAPLGLQQRKDRLAARAAEAEAEAAKKDDKDAATKEEAA